MRAEPRHIDIRHSLKQLKTATIVTAAIGRACYSEIPKCRYMGATFVCDGS